MKKQIALGCMRLAKLTIDEAEALIKKAVSEHITLFDHADIYGAGKCEEIFGEILLRNPDLRSKIKIQTKCGIGKGCYDLSKAHIVAQVERSLKALKTDYIDILLLHRPDALIDYQEVDEAFAELYHSGKVREFGVSNMNPYQIELFRKYVNQPIKYNQLQLSLVHCHLINQGVFVNMSESEAIDHSSGLIEYCRLHDISIQSWSSLMASWSEGSLINHPHYQQLNDLLSILATKYNVSKNAIAIAWILRHPANITAIVGTTNLDHLHEIVKARDIELTREEWYSLYLSVGHKLP